MRRAGDEYLSISLVSSRLSSHPFLLFIYICVCLQGVFSTSGDSEALLQTAAVNHSGERERNSEIRGARSECRVSSTVSRLSISLVLTCYQMKHHTLMTLYLSHLSIWCDLCGCTCGLWWVMISASSCLCGATSWMSRLSVPSHQNRACLSCISIMWGEKQNFSALLSWGSSPTERVKSSDKTSDCCCFRSYEIIIMTKQNLSHPFVCWDLTLIRVH